MGFVVMQASLFLFQSGSLASVDACVAADRPAPDKPAPKVTSDAKGRADEAQVTRLAGEAEQFKATGKLAEAIATGEKAASFAKRLSGDKSARVGDWQEWLAFLYECREDWPAAIEARREVLAIRSKQYGDKHWRAVDARLALDGTIRASQMDSAQIRELARAASLSQDFARLCGEGRYDKATQLAVDVAAMTKKVWGEGDRRYAQSLSNLAFSYQSQDQFAKAEPLFKQTLAIRKKALGAAHPESVQSLESLASLYHARGNYTRAEPLFREALEVNRSLWGERSPEYAATLENLANVTVYLGNYARAESMLQRALVLRQKIFGEHDSVYAESANDLGFLYFRQGDYGKARPLLQQAIDINSKSPGPPRAILGTNVDNLAKVEQALDNFARAEQLFRDALEIRAKALGVASPVYAISLGNLGLLYESEGDFARAEPLLKKALDVKVRALGSEHPMVAFSLDHLAELYWSTGDFARACPLYWRALAIRKKSFGEKHPFYAASLDNLATLYSLAGDYSRAEQFFRESLQIRKEVFGEARAEYAFGLNNLGRLCLARHNVTEAATLFRQALEIRKKVLGERHSDTAVSLNNLALASYAMGDIVKAETLCRQALEIAQEALDQALGGFAERQQLTFEASQQFYLHNYLSLAGPAHVVDSVVYSYVLKSKGSVTGRQSLIRVERRRPEVKKVFQDLETVSTRLANLALASPDPQHAAARIQEIDELTERKELLEKELAAKSADFGQIRAAVKQSPAQQLKKLQAALPPRTALVDVLEYWHGSPAPERKGQFTFERRLVAFVVRHDAQVKQVDLGAAKNVGRAVENWRRVAVEPDRPRTNGLENLQKLSTLVWDKLEPHLAGAETILLSPDGPLCRFPLGVLPGSKPDRFLIEERTIVVIPIPRFLPQLLAVVQEKKDRPQAESLLLVGGVEYGGSPGGADELASRSAPAPTCCTAFANWSIRRPRWPTSACRSNSASTRRRSI
jgi:tetratricopeptide (TPR) repeat protein